MIYDAQLSTYMKALVGPEMIRSYSAVLKSSSELSRFPVSSLISIRRLILSLLLSLVAAGRFILL